MRFRGGRRPLAIPSVFARYQTVIDRPLVRVVSDRYPSITNTMATCSRPGSVIRHSHAHSVTFDSPDTPLRASQRTKSEADLGSVGRGPEGGTW